MYVLIKALFSSSRLLPLTHHVTCGAVRRRLSPASSIVSYVLRQRSCQKLALPAYDHSSLDMSGTREEARFLRLHGSALRLRRSA